MTHSNESFHAIFEAAPAGISLCDMEGRYRRVNRAFCDCLGYSAAELYRMSYRDVTHPDDLPASEAQIARLLSDEKRSYQLEKRFLRKDGSIAWAMISVSLALTAAGEPLYLIGQILDVSPQKDVERALLASEQSLENAQRIANLGDWESDLLAKTMRWSRGMYRILGLPAQAPEIITLRGDATIPPLYLDAIHPDDREMVLNTLRNAIHKKEWFALDHRIVRADGEERVVYARGEPRLGSDGRIAHIAGTLQDITERKGTELDLLRARRQLRALSVHQESVVEEERKHIAREVHDEMGQRLTALQLGLAVLRERHQAGHEVAADIAGLQSIAADAIDVVRHISTRLRPPVLDLGLLAAIEWLAEDFRYRWEVDCLVDIKGEAITFREPIAATLFRVVQESLNNVAKHAQAQSVLIALVNEAQRVTLSISDDGRGFDPAVVRQKPGFGLLGMRERVLALGGTLFVKSAVDQGTRVAIELPLGELAP